MVEYRPTKPCRETLEAGARIAVLTCLLACICGCSFSIPSLVPSKPEDVTGSIAPAVGGKTLSPELGQEDWRRAKVALALALDPQGDGHAVRWDNPDTRLRGEITPRGAPFVDQDEICRLFTATIAHPSGRLSTFEGSACRLTAGDWELRRLARKA